MILEMIARIIIVFALMRLMVTLVNYLTRPYLDGYPVSSQPLVSILIPARNEENNLPVLLESLIKQDYTNYELMVYDDHSEDGTSQILEQYSEKDPRISWIKGKQQIPPGWTGKNHACHHLGKEARGDILLFMDADMVVSTDMLNKATDTFRHYRLSLLSIFPHQLLKSRGEWLTVPLMNWILLSLLPLILVRKSHRPSLAAANGQFMMFNARVYKEHLWHKQVKQNLVEDIVISRMMKTAGYNTATLLGRYDVMCRMYSSWGEAVNGFAKNVVEFFGGNIVVAIIYTLLTFSGVVIIPLSLGWEWFAFYIAIVLLIRVFISLTSMQSVWKNIRLHLFQMASFLYIMAKGIKVKLTGRYQWKGRTTGGQV
ncbi:MAG: glycosyltransferase family 2 protein [Bacteroidales bacterium]|nr:glycosyltransferase family 2 protein [Bacteroidales bacterium]